MTEPGTPPERPNRARAPEVVIKKVATGLSAWRRAPAIATRSKMGSLAPVFYITGAMVATVVVLMGPLGPHHHAARWAILVSIVSVLAGALMYKTRHHIPMWAYGAAGPLSTAMITLLVVLAQDGTTAAALALGFLVIPLYRFSFYSVLTASLHVFVVLAAVVLLAAIGDISSQEAFALSALAAISGAVTGWLVRAAQSAEIDPLTSLANRTGLVRALRAQMAVYQHNGGHLAGALFDIEDQVGRGTALTGSTGDAMLRAVADEVRAVLPAGALASRYNTMGFAVIFPGLDATEAKPHAEALRSAIARHHSVAAALSDMAPTDTPTMFSSRLRSVLYEAKRTASGAVLCRPSNGAATAELQEAVGSGALVVLYQPIVSLANSKVLGAEALVRWEHPTRGTIPPDQFISLAEESGLILEVGKFVLTEALRAAAHWPEGSKVNVNASAHELAAQDYAGLVASALASTGTPPGRLVIEVTESQVANGGRVLDNLCQLRSMGVRVALDDFGTGYSSLSQLVELPVDFLKIDRSFIARISPGSERDPIVEAVCALAKATGKTVVAEGVEHQYQAVVLEAGGCHEAQGYLYGRPGAIDALLPQMEEQPPLVLSLKDATVCSPCLEGAGARSTVPDS